MRFSELTTIQVGGEVANLVEAGDARELVDAALAAWGAGEEVLVLGGGSNLVVSDDGFDGVTIRVATRGIERFASETGVHLRVAAGESWDGLVAFAVENGWAGVEALSGIPGSVGAAPIQNIGAYGQEVSDALVSVDFLDYLTGDFIRLRAADLALGYRTSAIKEGRAGVVVAVDLRLADAGADRLSAPIVYEQLASALGAGLGARVPLDEVRATVLRLRASKGMVLDPADPDSVSAGSFFTNPLVSASFARGLPADAPRWPVAPEPADRFVPLGQPPAPPAIVTDDRVKLSAAWLIERAGITRGFRLLGSRAAISSKHTLAITNTGGATSAQIGQLARYVQTRVFNEFGVQLAPEPNLIGFDF